MNQHTDGKQRRTASLLSPVYVSYRYIVDRLRGERGATATEYAILVTLIGLAIVTGVLIFGQSLDGWFHRLGDAIKPYVS